MPVALLGRGEVRAEEEDLQLAVAVERVGELAELLADLVELVRPPWRPRRARRRIRGRSPPLACSSLRCRSRRRPERREVHLGERLLDQLLVVLVVSDLRVSFSVASTVRSATSLRICSSERRVSVSMSLRAAATSSSRLALPSAVASATAASAALRARAAMSSACSRASFRRARYSARSSSASSRVFSDGSMFSRIALARFSSASRDLRERRLAQDVHRDPEQEQRPDHQPEARRDQEAAALLLACAASSAATRRTQARCRSRTSMRRPRGRTR